MVNFTWLKGSMGGVGLREREREEGEGVKDGEKESRGREKGEGEGEERERCKGRERKERVSSMWQFSSQMPVRARAGPGGSQSPELQSRSSTWVPGVFVHLLLYHLLPQRVDISRRRSEGETACQAL